MNRSLLLVICDFLLLSLLGFVRFDAPQSSLEDSEPEPKYSEEPLPDSRDDLIAMLEVSLEQVRDQQAVINSKLNEKILQSQDMEKNLKENLAQKESLLNQLENQVEQQSQRQLILEIEKEEIAQKLFKTKGQLVLQKKEQDQSKQLQEAEKKEITKKLEKSIEALQKKDLESTKLKNQLLSSKYQSKLKSERVQVMEQVLETSKQRLEILEAALAKSNIEKEVLLNQKIKAEEKLLDSQKNQEILAATLKTEKAIRNELSNQTDRLVAGFQNLTESSQKVVEAVEERTNEVVRKIDSTLTLSPNQVFAFFQKNLVTVTFESKELGPLSIGSVERSYTSQSPILNVKGDYFAVLHVKNSPYGNTFEPLSVQSRIRCGNNEVDSIGLFSDRQDSSLLWVQLPEEWLLRQNRIPAEQTTNPFAFQEAILINPNNLQYGSLRFRIDNERFSPFLKTDNRLSTRLFGDFSASAGDYLFTQNGKFLGIQTTSGNALWIQDPELIPITLN